MHMNLRDYLHFNYLSVQEFADKIGYRREYVGKISNRRIIPSKRLAAIIEKATDGKVTVEDLMKGE